jgi:ketosteroid isomerase-like protein
MNALESINRVRQFFESLSPESIDRIEAIYAEDAWFKDPFNEVRGLPAIRRIFERMFEQVEAPHFAIRDFAVTGEQAFLTWDFTFRFKRSPQTGQVIHGATHLRFSPEGKVNFHRDYWDAAGELYEKLPLLGGLMRFIKKRAAS